MKLRIWLDIFKCNGLRCCVLACDPLWPLDSFLTVAHCNWLLAVFYENTVFPPEGIPCFIIPIFKMVIFILLKFVLIFWVHTSLVPISVYTFTQPDLDHGWSYSQLTPLNSTWHTEGTMEAALILNKLSWILCGSQFQVRQEEEQVWESTMELLHWWVGL